MEKLDWKKVNELCKPSPSYEAIIQGLHQSLAYGFVVANYNHDMKGAEEFAKKLLGNDPKKRYGAYLEKLVGVFKHLDTLGVKDYLGLISRVETREKFEKFFEKSGLEIVDIIRTLRFLLNWVLPQKIYLTEIVDKDDPAQMVTVMALRGAGVKFNLDALEKGMTKKGREKLAKEANVAPELVLNLVNRADFTRMPWTRGSTVKNYFNSGWDSMEKLAKADLKELTADVSVYMKSVCKKLNNAIELDSGIENAKVFPMIVEQ